MSDLPNSAVVIPNPTIMTTSTELTERQRIVMLVMMTLAAVCSQLDRSITSLVLEPIRKEFNLSDTELGVAAGLAFAIGHAISSLPLGRFADRVNRRNLIAGCLLVWSGMTALCGLAGSYFQFVLARAGVGAGEAGGQSTGLSVVSDLYSEKRRATAIAIFYLAAPIGAMLAGALAGPITATYGWRAAMLVAGVPGLVMVITLFLFGKDPPREAVRASLSDAAAPSFGDVLRFVRSQQALLHLFAALGLIAFILSGLGSFTVSFFIRYHHMTQREMGEIIGTTSAATTLISLGSGMLADRLSRSDPRWRLWLIIPVQLINTFLLLIAFTASGVLALPAYIVASLMNLIWIGPGLATAQTLTPSRMRGTSAGILYLLINFFGFGFGPLILGAMSDALTAYAGPDGLRWSVIIISLMNVWAALHFFLATRTLKNDLARVAATV